MRLLALISIVVAVAAFNTDADQTAPPPSLIRLRNGPIHVYDHASEASRRNLRADGVTNLCDDTSGETFPQLVLFHSGKVKLNQRVRDFLALATTIVNYVPDNTYTLHISSTSELESVCASVTTPLVITMPSDSKITHSTPYFLERKGDDRETLGIKIVRAGDESHQQQLVDVVTSSCGDGATVRVNAGLGSMSVTAPADDLLACLDEIANHHLVYLVSPRNRRTTSSSQASPYIRTNDVSKPFPIPDLDGTGQVVGVYDSGVAFEHCLFDDGSGTLEADTVNTEHKIMYFQTDLTLPEGTDDTILFGPGPDGHGTGVAGCIGGETGDETVSDTIGVAPKAKIWHTSQSPASGGEESLFPDVDIIVSDIFKKSKDDGGVKIHNNSWGCFKEEAEDCIWYDEETLAYDEFMWENKDFLLVFAAGNDGIGVSGVYPSAGTVGSPAGAKNAMSVGAHFNTLAGWQSQVEYYDTGEDAALNWHCADACCDEDPLPDDCDPDYCFENHECCEDRSTCPELCEGVDEWSYCQWDAADATTTCTCAADATDLYTEETHNETILSGYSSQGPMLDGRMKPDILAVGNVLTAASVGDKPSEECPLMIHDGTSFASPNVAGALVLVDQYFKDGYYPTQTKTESNAIDASAALLKAVLINGAQRPLITKYWELVDKDDETAAYKDLENPGQPSNQIGFGVANVEKSVLPDYLWVNEDISLETGEKRELIVHGAAAGDFSFTIVWTDYPGSGVSEIDLVNNIDLKIFNGETEDEDNVAFFADDALNNVEQARLTTTGTHSYLVVVDGVNVPFGPQPVALVVSATSSFTVEAKNSASTDVRVQPDDGSTATTTDTSTTTTTDTSTTTTTDTSTTTTDTSTTTTTDTSTTTTTDTSTTTTTTDTSTTTTTGPTTVTTSGSTALSVSFVTMISVVVMCLAF